MRLLFELDRKDYGQCTRTYVRNSARSIIISGGKIAMVHSLARLGRSTSMREIISYTRFSSAVPVMNSMRLAYGLVHRIQKSTVDETECFIQDNYYYLCKAADTVESQNLDDYEAEERFTLEYIDPKTAIETNRRADHGPKDPVMLEREARVLEMLISEGLLGEER